MQNPAITAKPKELPLPSDSKKSSTKNIENKKNSKFEFVEIPPPDDIELSLSSFSSSISLPDVNTVDQVNLIKSKNKELKRAATLTMQDFKNTSKYLITRSQANSNRGSILLNAEECELRGSEMNYPGSAEFDGDIGEIYRRIQEIQIEIKEASQNLINSEKMILNTEEKNFLMEKKIKELEKSMKNVGVVEGGEKSIKEFCKCAVL